MAADISESLYHGRAFTQVHFQVFRRFLDQINHTASGGFISAAGSPQHQWFSGNNCRNSVPLFLAVGIHNPGHDPFVRSHIGSRNILIRADNRTDFCGKAPRQPLQFMAGQPGRINANSPLCSSKREMHERAFPAHPHGQCRNFTQADILVITNPPFRRPHRQNMLDSITKDGLHLCIMIPPKG